MQDAPRLTIGGRVNNTCHDARPARWHLRFWALSLGVAVFSGCAGCPGRGVEDDSTSSSGGGVSSSGPASGVSLGSSSGGPFSSSGASSAGGASSGGQSGSGVSGTSVASGTATSAQPGSSSSLSSPSSSSGASASSGGPLGCANPLNGTRYGLCNHGLELETGRIQGSRFGTQGTLSPGDVQPAVGTRFQIRGNTTVKH
jgi:hypothetical protein